MPELSFEQFLSKDEGSSKDKELSFDPFLKTQGTGERKIQTYYPIQQEKSKQAQEMMASGIHEIFHPGDFTVQHGGRTFYEGPGFADVGKGILKTGLGALAYVGSPFDSAARVL